MEKKSSQTLPLEFIPGIGGESADLRQDRYFVRPIPQTKPSDPIPRPKSARYKSLDIWRGIACLMVVVEHTALWGRYDDTPAEAARHPLASHLFGMFHRLDVAVPMFFVISGYCIAATADFSRRLLNSSTLNYFKRRIKRIYPPYWILIALILLVSLGIKATGRTDLLTMNGPGVQALPERQPLDPYQWLGSLTLTETWRDHVLGSHHRQFIEPAWTLCYEEQFYIVCGVLLLIAPRRFFTGLTIVTLLTIPPFILSLTHPNFNITGFFFDGQWLTFAMGLAVYYQLNYATPRAAKFITASLAATFLFFMTIRYAVFTSDDIVRKNQFFTLASANAFALLISVLRPMDTKITNARFLWPLAICGQMCYSLYLIHWPVSAILGHLLFQDGIRGLPSALLITVPVVTLVSVGLSWIFHQQVERHFLNAPQKTAATRAEIPIGEKRTSRAA